MEYNLERLEQDLKSLNSTKEGRRLFVAAMPLLLASCATKTTSDRYREGSNKGQKTSITVADEKKMAHEYLPKMKKDYPVLRDSQLQSYIQNLGQKIVHKNNLNNNPYKYNFTVVESKAVNAFALPAGEVFVTTPLLAMAQSEAELAGVLGHEIGHIKARHTAERIDTAKKAQSKSVMYGIGGGLGGLLVGFGLGKLICRKNDRECIERISKYGAMAGAAGGLLIQKYGFMANSREDEMEADRIGFRTSLAAGFHKDHIGSFYAKLLEMEKKHKGSKNKLLASFADAMSTHPPSEERVKQMHKMSMEVKSSKNAIISSKQFDEAKKRLKRYI
ncbi:MAG: M48 family metalloprotease [Bacteriovoracaceae bacterium]|jgi:predicted Zn-dependent protease|nr:M48 family metalloprotease [Bacteriovoracaceae bacterium]